MNQQLASPMSVLLGSLLVLVAIGLAIFFAMPTVHVQLLGGGNYTLLSSSSRSFVIEVGEVKKTHGVLIGMLEGKQEIAMRGRKLKRSDSSKCNNLMKEDPITKQMVLVTEEGCAHTYCSDHGLVVVVVPLGPRELSVSWRQL